MTDSIIVASPTSVIEIFGLGFLLGSLFSILILLVFDWLRAARLNNATAKKKK